MINPVDHSCDTDFKLKEVRFFMEHFRKSSYDDLALMIAKDIYSFLNLGGNYNDILTYTIELETFSEKTNSEDFAWNLVYIRRKISDALSENGDAYSAAECALITAKHFDTICKIKPSTHNLCCRILEYLNASNSFKNIDNQEKRLECIDYCEKKFDEIEKNSERLYIRVAYKLHVEIYLANLNRVEHEISYNNLKKSIDYGIIYYEAVIDARYVLKTLIIACDELTTFKTFSYQNEKEKIYTVIGYAKKAIDDGATYLLKTYNHLRYSLTKFEGIAGFNADNIDFFD